MNENILKFLDSKNKDALSFKAIGVDALQTLRQPLDVTGDGSNFASVTPGKMWTLPLLK